MENNVNPNYPTKQHDLAAKKIVEIFSMDKSVMTILLTCSCARGKASKDSCLDITVLVEDLASKDRLKQKFTGLEKTIKEFVELKKVGKFSHIDFSVSDGRIAPKPRSWTSGPDEFELEIANTFVYVHPLFDRDNYFTRVSKSFLPYYDEKLRIQRLLEAKKFCLNNLEHIPLYVDRGLYFHAFDRFYKATKEFMQALFIKHKTYPIAYDKWVKEQFVEILKMPELYPEMVKLLEIKHLESNELKIKARRLGALLKKYC